jgi:hypothetical protein
MYNLNQGNSELLPKEPSPRASVFTYEVSDEALEAAAVDYLEVSCSQCGGSCNSGCTKNTNRDTRVHYETRT